MPSGQSVTVFFTDQQRWDTCGCYGGPMGLTPNLDALARRGVRFERAFTCQPVCAPARGSLQTALHATAHGVWRNGIALPGQCRTLGHRFTEAGYDVGYLGKWHLANTEAAPSPGTRATTSSVAGEGSAGLRARSPRSTPSSALRRPRGSPRHSVS